jgi:hypothetical protein
MPRKKKTPTHGGAREGAGRKKMANAKRAVTFKLAVPIVEYLDTVPSKVAAVESAITDSDGYRKWSGDSRDGTRP